MVNDWLIVGGGWTNLNSTKHQSRAMKPFGGLHDIRQQRTAPNNSSVIFQPQEAIMRQAFFSYELLALVYIGALLFACGSVGHIVS